MPEMTARKDMEEAVRRTMFGAHASREGWVERLGGDRPNLDALIPLLNVAELIRRQGRVLAILPLKNGTGDDVEREITRAVETLPGQLEARVYREVSVPALIGDLAESLGIHRVLIRRVAHEQLRDPGEVDAVLERAPIPERDDDDRGAKIVRATNAHAEALLVLARGIDAWYAEG